MKFWCYSQSLQQPPTDPLVVTINIEQKKVRWVVVDTRSTVDLITTDCLKQIKFEEKRLQHIDKPLIGFAQIIIYNRRIHTTYIYWAFI